MKPAFSPRKGSLCVKLKKPASEMIVLGLAVVLIVPAMKVPAKG